MLVALSRLVEVIDFSVTSIASTDLSQVSINDRTCIVVATHGQYDELALEQALRSPARYVALVASHRRAEACREYLRDSGLTEQQIERLKAPAGLDIGAVTPEEIAVSILAELVQVRRGELIEQSHELHNQHSKHMPTHDTAGSPESAGTATDPVCGMIVEISTARHHSVLNGRDYYFCCPACKRLFERNPQEYLPPIRPAERS